MHTLILSCSTGEGHNSCAGAIQAYYAAQGEDCQTIDALGFISKGAPVFFSKGHSWVYRHLPKLFRWGYQFSERHPGVFCRQSAVYKLLTRGTGRLAHYILEGSYDQVICTHVFSALMLTAAIRDYGIRVASCFVSTDYTCSPSTSESDLDFYFIPDVRLSKDFVNSGLPQERLIASGIPVRQMFYDRENPRAAKEAFGLTPGQNHLLVMSGSMGCGPIRKLVKRIAAALPENWEVSVVCGTNKTLQRKLERQFAGDPRVFIRGYVKEMARLMDSADLYLTKPGGISVSEAAVKELPMALIDAVAGCEDYNRRYFQELGGAITALDVAALSDCCLALMRDPAARQKMHCRLAEAEKQNAAAIIFETMQGKMEELYDENQKNSPDGRTGC